MQASCEKRPMSLSGVGSPFSLPTSNCQPCPGRVVSSPVIQVPHGVTPPAQLRTVPARRRPRRLPSARASCRTRRLVVPPPPSSVGDGWRVDVRASANAALVIADQNELAGVAQRVHDGHAVVQVGTGRAVPQTDRRSSCTTCSGSRPAVAAAAVPWFRRASGRSRHTGSESGRPSTTLRDMNSPSETAHSAPAPIAPRRMNVRRSTVSPSIIWHTPSCARDECDAFFHGSAGECDVGEYRDCDGRAKNRILRCQLDMKDGCCRPSLLPCYSHVTTV